MDFFQAHVGHGKKGIRKNLKGFLISREVVYGTADGTVFQGEGKGDGIQTGTSHC